MKNATCLFGDPSSAVVTVRDAADECHAVLLTALQTVENAMKINSKL